jgi:hypothetical protein
MPATSPHPLSETALRVLAAWTQGKTPAPEDMDVLRRSALPEERGLEIDQLACQVIERELLCPQRAQQETQRKQSLEGCEPEHPAATTR